MAFFEQRFPEEISLGASGGPRWSTLKVYTASGRRFTNRMWSWPLQTYQVDYPPIDADEFKLLRAHVYVCGGDADAFRFKDWTDYEDDGDGTLTLVSGSEYQMYKRYIVGPRTFSRIIQKPVAGVSIFRTRSGSTTDITGGSTVDTTTGRVVVAGHMSGDTYSWVGEFDVPAAFSDPEAIFRVVASAPIVAEWPSIRIEEVRL